MRIQKNVQSSGGNLCVLIGKKVASELGLEKGTPIMFEVVGDKIIIEKYEEEPVGTKAELQQMQDAIEYQRMQEEQAEVEINKIKKIK